MFMLAVQGTCRASDIYRPAERASLGPFRFVEPLVDGHARELGGGTGSSAEFRRALEPMENRLRDGKRATSGVEVPAVFWKPL